MSEGFSPIGYTAQLLGLETFLGGLSQIQAAVVRSQAAGPLKVFEAGAELGLLSMGRGFDMMTAKAVAAGQAIHQAISSVINTIVDFGKRSVEVAARVDEVNQVLYLQGARHGYTKEQIDKNRDSIRDYGIETSVAQTSLQQFLKYNIKLEDGLKLARIAQDAATEGATNSSDALQRMIWGITTGQTEVLKGIGITVSFDQAYRALGKTAGQTTANMDSAAKVQSRVNAVIAEGIKMAGNYEASLETPSKMMRQISRHLEEAQLAIGKNFQGAYYGYVTTLMDLAKGFRAAVEEGGALHPLLQRIGAMLWVVADAGKGIAKSLFNEGIPALVSFVDQFAMFATDALAWGVNLASSFLGGFVEGIAIFGTTAMRAVGGLLDEWLKGLSPPRVAPNIDLWGMNTMQEYLKGFSKADFSVLDSVENSLKAVFDTLEAAGKMAGSAAAKAIADFSMALGQVVAGTASQAAVIQQIALAAGADFGPALANVLNLQLGLQGIMNQASASSKALEEVQQRVADFQLVVRAAQDKVTAAQERAEGASRKLALATKEQAVAQERLNRAQQIEAAAMDRITQQMAAYNEAVERGAGPQALAGRMNLVRAAQQQALVATQERRQAEVKVQAAAAEVKLRQQEVELRQQDVQVAQDSANAIGKQAQALQREADTASRANQVVQRQLRDSQEQMSLAQSALNEQIQMARMQVEIAAKLAGEVTPKEEDLLEAKAPKFVAGKDIADLKAQIEAKLLGIFDPVVKEWNKPGGISDTLKALRGEFDDLMLKVTKFKEGPLKEFNSSLGITDDQTKPVIESIGKITGIFTGLGIVALAVKGIIALLGSAIGGLSWPVWLIIGLISVLAVAWTENWLGMRETLTKWFEQAGYDIDKWIRGAVRWVEDAFLDISRVVSHFWDNFMRGLKDIQKGIDEWMQGLPDWMKKLLGVQVKITPITPVPSELNDAVKKEFMEYLKPSRDVQPFQGGGPRPPKGGDFGQTSIVLSAPQMISAPLLSAPRTVTNNFYNTVSDRMSAAQFQAMTERAVENALG